MFKKISDILSLDSTQKKENKNESFYSTRHNRKFNKLFTVDSLEFVKLIQEWKNIVGQNVYPNTRPLRIHYNLLIILTRHSTFSHELSFMKDEILNRVFEICPKLKKRVTDIRFQTNPNFFISIPFRDESNSLNLRGLGTSAQKRIHPYNPKYRKIKLEAENKFSHIKNSEIKDLFISIYIKNFI